MPYDNGYSEWPPEHYLSESERAEMDAFECVPVCPVCGDVIDYCLGHGEIGDPRGWAILVKHDNGDHSDCVINCEEE